MDLVYDKAVLKNLAVGEIIEYDGSWLIIEGLSYDYKQIRLSGHDLGIVLSMRVSTYNPDAQESGTQGYDVVQGTTAQCIEHYIDNNLINPANSERAVPMSFDANGVHGEANDHYMARLENVSDIVTALCDDAGIGYVADLYGGLIRIRLKASTDKSITQSARAWVIFAAERGNVTGISFEHDSSNFLNAVYATGAEVTEVVYRSLAVVPEGLERYECAVDLSINSVDDIRDYALKAVESNTVTHAYQLSVPAGDYGVKYQLGDKVTVEETELGNRYTAVITEVKFSQGAGHKSIAITLGRQKPKLLNTIVNNIMSGTARRN